jgi:tRNA_anti-like
MKKRKKILIIGGVILGLGVIAALYIYKEYNRTHKDTANLQPDYSMKATQLIKEFDDDEQSSNEKYWNKVIQVDGIIKDTAKDDRGFYSVVLGDTSDMSSVRCSMDSVHNKDAASLQKGTIAFMKGICTGFKRDDLLGSDVVFIRCVVDSKK